ncbi:MAG: serine/threonine-protein kinase [Sandaracinaceae bacterium]
MSRRCPACGTEYPDEIAFCGHDGSVNIEVQPPDERPDSRLGETLGDYIVVAHVADGAMGAVYEARNAETRARVAIKVLHPDVLQDEIACERFRREYETADMLDHPHIVKVIDFGETADGNLFLTMEYLEGTELGQVLRGDGFSHPARPLRMLAQAAAALEDAHAFGVIHRDLKPDNIFLCRDERGDDVRILDFGSVKLQVETGPKLTAFGTTLGSPYYMSPEQAKGLPDVDNRTDVFALGAMLYECLTGAIAFEAKTVAEILMKIVKQDPAPATSVAPSLPKAIDDVLLRAIKKDKNDRYSTPSEFVTAALSAFGVAGTAEEWAAKSEAELREAIDRVAVPAAPVGGEGVDPMGMTMPSEELSGHAAEARAAAQAMAAPVLAGPAVAAPPAAANPVPQGRPQFTQPGQAEVPTAIPGMSSGNRALVLVGLALVATIVMVVAALVAFLVLS